MTDRIPYKGRNLDVFVSSNGWMVEITDALGRRSVAEARTIERAINTAYEMIDREEAAVAGASIAAESAQKVGG
jgi:hypothetical protein